MKIKKGIIAVVGDLSHWLQTNLTLAWKNPEIKKALQKFLTDNN